MSSKPQQSPQHSLLLRPAWVCLLGLASCTLSGCQDGPLYALKTVNPYYSMGEWKRDQAIGVTDDQRRKELALLANSIHQLPADKQKFWAGHLEKLIENDDSPEMRRLAIKAAGRVNDPSAITMIQKGLDDDSMKVRMEACTALGLLEGDDAARILAATVGTETSEDVKHAALTALANHKNQIAVDSLKIALADRNPATRSLAIESLKSSTGKNYGDDPAVWIAALEGKSTEEVPTKFAERVRGFF